MIDQELMFSQRERTSRVGFALIELAVVLATCATVLVLLIPALLNMRKEARLATDLGKFHNIAGWTDSYAADFENHFPIFSWQGGETYSASLPTLMFAQDDLQAAANQAIEIIRTAGGRSDITQIISWIPHPSYGHLVLAQYADRPLLGTDFVSAADRHRINWTKDPQNKFEVNFWLPYQPVYSGSTAKRWPYSASYEFNPAMWDRGAVAHLRVYQTTSTSQYSIPGMADLGPHLRSEMRYPSNKAVVYDKHSRHFDRNGAYFWLPEAKIPVLFGDGSASVRSIADANLSMSPNMPTYTAVSTQATHTPSTWEPQLPGGAPSMFLIDRIRWTRAGLKGRDFGGPVVVELP
ncbi:MAG: hypothetical protein H6815_03155 [Phycisphaeraceae bacterium]|nr:hypothetical protein [Phycisphaerales bacterium]MCB9859426.1 hypothetical protein [Phycisphaeraceae bacterium]